MWNKLLNDPEKNIKLFVGIVTLYAIVIGGTAETIFWGFFYVRVSDYVTISDFITSILVLMVDFLAFPLFCVAISALQIVLMEALGNFVKIFIDKKSKQKFNVLYLLKQFTSRRFARELVGHLLFVFIFVHAFATVFYGYKRADDISSGKNYLYISQSNKELVGLGGVEGDIKYMGMLGEYIFLSAEDRLVIVTKNNVKKLELQKKGQPLYASNAVVFVFVRNILGKIFESEPSERQSTLEKKPEEKGAP